MVQSCKERTLTETACLRCSQGPPSELFRRGNALILACSWDVSDAAKILIDWGALPLEVASTIERLMYAKRA